MKKLSIVIALFSVALVQAQTTWNIDPSHSSIRFAVDHMVISEVEGIFSKYEGSIVAAKEDFSDAKINFVVDVNSVNTDNEKRDGHLKSADFFETEKYPKMTFVSTSVEKTGAGKYNLKGNLSLHGVTKEITLAMTYGGTTKDPWGNTKAGLKVTGVINRTDFGLKYNSVLEAGSLMIGEEVTITAKVELAKI
ncbi:MAG: polyisoprenoid-binding protein [Bacteroidetes bacterium HGW-Bacteroidetes-18]|nr:MAG: polyisoprenoid-binding protein [Bacteroidetes bacterium HGW-Bacteroidetes-18]